MGYSVANTHASDLDAIFDLFDRSADYQEKHGYPSWRNYDKNAIIRDIEVRRQFKVVAGSEIGIVFSIAHSDRIIWRHMDDGSSIYLHRVVVNPAFKGQQLFKSVLDWAIDLCRQKGLQYVRMDTWANNPKIIDYYKTFGFREVEKYTTPDTEELPEHNRKLALMLLEYKLN